MEEPNFWDNPEEAQEQMKQLSSMKEDRDTYQKLVSAKEDMDLDFCPFDSESSK